MIYDSYIRTVDPGAKSGRQAKPHWPRHFSCIESQTVLVLREYVRSACLEHHPVLKALKSRIVCFLSLWFSPMAMVWVF